MLLKNVVVGSCVRSALYALLTDSLFVNTRIDPPMFYRSLQVPILGTSTEPEAWSKLSLMLSFLGKKIDTLGCRVVILENKMKIYTSVPFQNIDFNNCWIFDTTSLEIENELQIPKQSEYLVLDDFELSYLGGETHIESVISPNNKLMRKLFFYSSDRIAGFSGVSDCVSESLLTKSQLHDFDFSDTTVRFMVERHLESAGVRGKFMNFYKNGTSKYRKPKVKHVSRLVFQKDKNVYKNSETVKFLSLELKDIINEFSTKR